jgi:hypothetical protein
LMTEARRADHGIYFEICTLAKSSNKNSHLVDFFLDVGGREKNQA